MKKITFILQLVALFVLQAGYSQSGNTINEAIEIDGIGIGVGLLNYNSATPSGFSPLCSSAADVFYRHTISDNDTRFAVGLSSAAIALFTEIDYQLLRAPGGNLDGLEVLTCDDYNVVLISGGSYEQIFENVTPGDVYYLRVFKPSGLAGLLSGLLNGTAITMVSDSTLSTDMVDENQTKIVVKDDVINIYGNFNYNQFAIYDIGGKQLYSKKSNENVNSVDISGLSSGLYILSLQDNEGIRVHKKFVKR